MDSPIVPWEIVGEIISYFPAEVHRIFRRVCRKLYQDYTPRIVPSINFHTKGRKKYSQASIAHALYTSWSPEVSVRYAATRTTNGAAKYMGCWFLRTGEIELLVPLIREKLGRASRRNNIFWSEFSAWDFPEIDKIEIIRRAHDCISNANHSYIIRQAISNQKLGILEYYVDVAARNQSLIYRVNTGNSRYNMDAFPVIQGLCAGRLSTKLVEAVLLCLLSHRRNSSFEVSIFRIGLMKMLVSGGLIRAEHIDQYLTDCSQSRRNLIKHMLFQK